MREEIILKTDKTDSGTGSSSYQERMDQFGSIMEELGLKGKLQPVNSLIGMVSFSLYPKILPYELPSYLGLLNGFQAELIENSGLGMIKAQIGPRSFLNGEGEIVRVLGDYLQIFPWLEQLGNKKRQGSQEQLTISDKAVWLYTQIKGEPFMIRSRTHWLRGAIKQIRRKYNISGSNISTQTFCPDIKDEYSVLAIEERHSAQNAYLILTLDRLAHLELVGEKELVIPIVDILNRFSKGKYGESVNRQLIQNNHLLI